MKRKRDKPPGHLFDPLFKVDSKGKFVSIQYCSNGRTKTSSAGMSPQGLPDEWAAGFGLPKTKRGYMIGYKSMSRQKCILVAEDNEDDLYLLQLAFEKVGFSDKLMNAWNGEIP